MGSAFSRTGLFAKFFYRTLHFPERRILMVGLDGAGKTTVLYKLKLGEVVSAAPTIGFNVETLEHKSINLTVWDVGGQDRIRALWKHYYAGTHGVVFVVDSSDTERLDGEAQNCRTAVAELHKMLQDDLLKDAVLLVLANKQDQPGALGGTEVAKRLKLSDRGLENRVWHIQGTVAVEGKGLYEGMDWLAQALKDRPLRGGLCRTTTSRPKGPARPQLRSHESE